MMEETQEFLATRWTLIQRLKNLEDHEGWEEFFNTYWKLIYSVALKAGLTHMEAQEVVQETVISVSKHIQSFKADPQAGSFKRWLLKLTGWRIMDQMRNRAPDAMRVDVREEDPTRTPLAERVPDPAGIELEQIWQEEWQDHLVDNALKKLETLVSAKHYQIFYLHVIKHMSAEKVAKALAINADQVYLIKHRLSRLFDEAVKELEAEPPFFHIV